MTQTNHAIHLSRVRDVCGSCLSTLRPGDGERWQDQPVQFKTGIGSADVNAQSNLYSTLYGYSKRLYVQRASSLRRTYFNRVPLLSMIYGDVEVSETPLVARVRFG